MAHRLNNILKLLIISTILVAVVKNLSLTRQHVKGLIPVVCRVWT